MPITEFGHGQGIKIFMVAGRAWLATPSLASSKQARRLAGRELHDTAQVVLFCRAGQRKCLSPCSFLVCAWLQYSTVL